MIGGFPTRMYLNPHTINAEPSSEPWLLKGEQFLMRLDSKTNRWQSEGSAGLPPMAWDMYHYIAITGQMQLWFASLTASFASQPASEVFST